MMKKVIILSMLMWSFCFEVLAGDKEILQQAYQLLVDKHVSRVSLYSVFTSAFSGLSEIDKNIKIVSETNSISVYYNGKLSKVYSVPENEENAKEWAEFSFYILEELKKISPKLQHKDFELVEFVLYKGINGFDKNSHYYPVLDIGQKEDKIPSYSVSVFDDDILYIRLGTINDYTKDLLFATLDENKTVKGILLDLRGNRGGYLRQTIEIIDEFLDEGQILYTMGREINETKAYRATKGERFKGIPMVVLVDGKTASSAEVLAMTLNDHNRADIVGAQTYGKASVQNVYELENGAKLALTTERFYSPRGFSFNEVGIRPTVCSEVFDIDSSIDELLEYPYNFTCPKFARNSTFDVDVALRVLRKKMGLTKM